MTDSNIMKRVLATKEAADLGHKTAWTLRDKVPFEVRQCVSDIMPRTLEVWRQQEQTKHHPEEKLRTVILETMKMTSTHWLTKEPAHEFSAAVACVVAVIPDGATRTHLSDELQECVAAGAVQQGLPIDTKAEINYPTPIGLLELWEKAVEK